MSTSAGNLITHRRMQVSADGTHEHVGWVKMYDGATYTRDQIISFLRQGHVIETRSPRGLQARVIEVDCRRCGYVYIRTDPDRWKEDNLDMLPTF
jgi:hypothetical protein